MRRLRALFLLVVFGWLVYGLVAEQHKVYRLDREESAPIRGYDFVNGATTDSYMLKDGKLYNTASLSPEGAQAKDCKT